MADMVVRLPWPGSVPVLLATLLVVVGMGCAALPPIASGRAGFDYFQTPATDDLWSAKIAGWQRRERFDAALMTPLEDGPAVDSGLEDARVADARRAGVANSAGESERAGHAAPASAPAIESDLREKYFDFRVQQRRALARKVASWIQSQARQHYREDGPVDHWATLEETLARGGDDCDGLELLVFHALRDLGFAESEVYRAIVVRPSDGQHHMVTLWFEDPDDPWVIDPTGAMTLGMPHMSELPDWEPIKVFSETVEYTVRDRAEGLAQVP
jgi:predicted transglutaminase-like cysteine proteinase